MDITKLIDKLPPSNKLEVLLICATASAANAGMRGHDPNERVRTMKNYLDQARTLGTEAPGLQQIYQSRAEVIVGIAKSAVEARVAYNQIDLEQRGGQQALQDIGSAGLRDDIEDTNRASQFLSTYIVP